MSGIQLGGVDSPPTTLTRLLKHWPDGMFANGGTHMCKLTVVAKEGEFVLAAGLEEGRYREWL